MSPTPPAPVPIPRHLTANRDRPGLLAVSYLRSATGFNRVLRSLLTPLIDHYDIHLIGLGYKGPVQTGDITIHPSNLHGGDVFGVQQARDFVDREQPALVLLLNDLWILAKYPRALAALPTPIVGYCPLDGRIPSPDLLAPLAAFDHLVVYTEFARQEFTTAASHLNLPANRSFPPISVIPHGVDTTTFYPLPSTVEAHLDPNPRRAIRQRFFPNDPTWHDAFIVLNANRPMPRKRIDLTLDGFAHFAHDKPATANIKLWLHHAIMTANERAALLAQATSLNLTDRLYLTPLDAPPLSDADLNLVYNACDVGLNTSLGEGWGLVSFEHAATGAAQIVPNHSACTELWSDSAELLPVAETYDPHLSPLVLAATTPDAVATALDRLYTDPDHLHPRSRAAYRTATQPTYHWDQIANQWHALFAELQE